MSTVQALPPVEQNDKAVASRRTNSNPLLWIIDWFLNTKEMVLEKTGDVCDIVRWELNHLEYYNPCSEHFRRVESVRKQFAIQVLYCRTTRRLPPLLRSERTLDERKIVQYVIFVRVVEKLEKLANGIHTINEGLAGKINYFQAEVRRGIDCSAYLVEGTIANMTEIQSGIKGVISEHEMSIQSSFPEKTSEERQKKIREKVIKNIGTLYCFAGKAYVWLSDEQMRERAERFYGNYRKAYEETRTLLIQDQKVASL